MKYPSDLHAISYSQKPSFLGISWEEPECAVDHYEVYTMKRSTNSDDAEAIITGKRDDASKTVLPSSCKYLVDNVSPQGNRHYYAVFAVDKEGNYIQPKFRVDLADPQKPNARFMKEPYLPMEITMISHSQKPAGIAVVWSYIPGDYEYAVLVANRSSFQPEELERLFTGNYEGGKLFRVARANEVIDDISPQGERRYYSVLTFDKNGNMFPLERFQTNEASRVTLKNPIKLSGGAIVKVVSSASSEATVHAIKKTEDAPIARPSQTLHPTKGNSYPSQLNPIPYSQKWGGIHIRIKPREGSSYARFRVVILTRSVPPDKIPNALEGKLDGARVYDIAPDRLEQIDNAGTVGTMYYYDVLGIDALGNISEVPFEVNSEDRMKFTNGNFLEPAKGRLQPRFPITIEQISSKQPWDGNRLRIPEPPKSVVRMQLVISKRRLNDNETGPAAEGKLDCAHAFEVPIGNRELIDNISKPNEHPVYMLLGYDAEGFADFIKFEVCSQDVEFKNPNFVDPNNLEYVKGNSDRLIAEGRKMLAGIGKDRRSATETGPQAVEQAYVCALRAHRLYPMYPEVKKLAEECIVKKEELDKLAIQYECDDALGRARELIKGDLPDYSNAEMYLDKVRKLQPSNAEMLSMKSEIACMKALDDKAREIYKRADKAHMEDRFDEAIALYEEVMRVNTRWNTKSNVAIVRDDKEFAGQLASAKASGKLDSFRAIYDDWLARGKEAYAWSAVKNAFEHFRDGPSFVMYERLHMKHHYWGEVVRMFYECEKEGFLEGIFGADKIKDALCGIDEYYPEIRRIDQEINDLKQQMRELENERSKLVGTGSSEYRTSVENSLERVQHAIQRSEERRREVVGKQAKVLEGLFGKD